MSGKFAPLSYIASPTAQTLEAYLMEALYLLELRFQSLDDDGAGLVILILWPECCRVSGSCIAGRSSSTSLFVDFP